MQGLVLFAASSMTSSLLCTALLSAGLAYTFITFADGQRTCAHDYPNGSQRRACQGENFGQLAYAFAYVSIAISVLSKVLVNMGIFSLFVISVLLTCGALLASIVFACFFSSNFGQYQNDPYNAEAQVDAKASFAQLLLLLSIASAVGGIVYYG